MFFLNLTAGEFFTLLGALGGLITLLYLLDRSKRRKAVSTLRFWTAGVAVEQQQSRRRMREPWSLILQLLSLVLMLLAIGQLQWGSRARRGRDHVLLLDTSAWSAERKSQGTLLDAEKRVAGEYLATLQPNDRALVARAGGLTAPATPFTSDHVRLLRAIAESTPGYSSFNAEQALAYARQAQASSGGEPGEIVYIGPKLISDQDGNPPNLPNLRILPVAATRENCGIVSLSVKHPGEDTNTWQAFMTIRNYGSESRTLRVKTEFAGTQFAPRTVAVKAGETQAIEYNFVTNAAGQLTAKLLSPDQLPSDDSATLYLPRDNTLRVIAYTSRAEFLKPLLSLNPRLSAHLAEPEEYVAKPAADVMIIDRFSPPAPPQIPSIWIQPPPGRAPIPVKATIGQPFVSTWNPQGQLTAGLRARELPVAEAEVFETFQGDTAVASAPEGPIIVVRPAHDGVPQTAAIGFDPFAGELRFRVTTPLLLANLLRWLHPDAFQEWEIAARQVGAAALPLERDEDADTIRIADEQGRAVPFAVRNHTLQLFVSQPSVIRVQSEHRTHVLSLTLPDVAAYNWKTPPETAEGIPASRFGRSAFDLWRSLAVAALFTLLLEWMLFGPRKRRARGTTATAANSQRPVPQREKELVSR